MAEIVRMPKLSDTMTEGTVAAWHKKVGDKVKAGDLLAEIETDKAVMEYESFQEGTLLHIGAQQGQTVKVDDAIAVIGKEGEDYKALLEQSTETKSDTDKKPEAEQKPEAEKSPQEKPEEAKVKEKDKEKPEEKEAEQEEPEEKEEHVVSGTEESTRVKASPLAKKIASASGVPITKIKGSGDDGRIVKRDVEKFLAEAPVKKPVAAPAV